MLLLAAQTRVLSQTNPSRIYYSPLSRSEADLGVQYNIPPLPTVSDHWLPVSVPIIFKCSANSFFHLSRGLSVSLVPCIVTVAICFGLLWFCILQASPHHLSQKDFIHFTVSICPSVSLFFLIPQSSSVMSPYIFRTSFLTNTLSTFIPSLATVQVSDRQVSMGRLTDLYICNFVFSGQKLGTEVFNVR